MALETTQSNTYYEALKTLLDDIVFDSSTLGAKNIIKKYQRSVRSKPKTEILIFRSRLNSAMLETRLQAQTYAIIIRIRVLAEDREEEAQNNLDYLVEQIINVLENNYNNVSWADGNLENIDFTSQIRTFNDNYYTEDIPIPIKKRENVVLKQS